MKRIIITLTLALLFLSAKAETVEAYRFTYEFCDSNSTAGYPDLMRLDVLPSGQSSFASVYHLAMKERTAGVTEADFSATLSAVMTARKGKSYTIHKNFPKGGQMTYLDKIGLHEFRITEPMDAIPWTLGDEEKNVCGYRCKRAEAAEEKVAERERLILQKNERIESQTAMSLTEKSGASHTVEITETIVLKTE